MTRAGRLCLGTALVACLSSGCGATPLRSMAGALNKVEDPQGEGMARLVAYAKGEYGYGLSGYLDWREDMLLAAVGPDDVKALAGSEPAVAARWDLLKRGGGASDGDIISAKAIATKIANEPHFFSRHIDEAGVNDGKQAEYFTLVLMAMGAAAQGAAAANSSSSGGGAGGQSHYQSHSSGHVASSPSVGSHTAAPHSGGGGVSHGSSVAHGGGASHVGSVAHGASAPRGVTARGGEASHGGASPRGGGTSHGASEGHREGVHKEGGDTAEHREHERPSHFEGHEARPELRARLKPARPSAQIQVQVGVRGGAPIPVAMVPVVLVPGGEFPVGTFTALGPEESSACDEAMQQAVDANPCLSSVDDVDISECSCTTFRDATGATVGLCSVGADVECKAAPAAGAAPTPSE